MWFCNKKFEKSQNRPCLSRLRLTCRKKSKDYFFYSFANLYIDLGMFDVKSMKKCDQSCFLPVALILVLFCCSLTFIDFYWKTPKFYNFSTMQMNWKTISFFGFIIFDLVCKGIAWFRRIRTKIRFQLLINTKLSLSVPSPALNFNVCLFN